MSIFLNLSLNHKSIKGFIISLVRWSALVFFTSNVHAQIFSHKIKYSKRKLSLQIMREAEC